MRNGGLDDVNNVAASFQAAATDVLLTKAIWMMEDFQINRVALAGGGSNNLRLRNLFLEEEGLVAYLPERTLTQDNGAMIAGLAYHKFQQGHTSGLDLEPRSRLGGIAKGKRVKHGK